MTPPVACSNGGRLSMGGPSLGFQGKIMSPPFFFVSLVSIFMIWMITIVGLPSYCWTYFVVPCVSVYCLCDRQKLSEELVREFIKSLRGASISVAILASLYVGYLPWKLVILLCCTFCLFKAFSSEKMMFSANYCGEIAKFAWWRVAKKLVPNQFDRMGWNGDWSYCSPYSRAPRRVLIDFYYEMSLQPSWDERIPESFDLAFPIEDCVIKCKYFAADENVRSSGNIIGSRTEVSEIKDDEEGTSSSEQRRDEAGTSSSSQRLEGAGASSSQRLERGGASSSQRPDEAGTSSSSQRPERAGASSSERPGGVAEADGCPLPQTRVVEGAVQNQTQVNKLEVSLCLLQGGEEIESFTFFRIDGGKIMEIKRAMEVLKRHGNLIFSSFHRDIGSHTPRAHAGCIEFEEMFERILKKGHTVQKVKLSRLHACSISGKAMMKVLQTAVIAWMQYYQLSSASTRSIITMLALFVLVQMFFLFLEITLSEKAAAKRLLHSLMKRTMPNQVDGWYKYFQVQCPYLTFCNQSYGHPCTLEDCRVICCFNGTAGFIPFTGHQHQYFDEDDMFDVTETFYNLRNVILRLDIRRDEKDDEVEALVVYVTCMWATNQEQFYQNIFRVIDRRKISNLIAVLNWLGANNWQGVCKGWIPKKNIMRVFTYDELIDKILDEAHYYRPWLIHFNNGRTVHVE